MRSVLSYCLIGRRLCSAGKRPMYASRRGAPSAQPPGSLPHLSFGIPLLSAKRLRATLWRTANALWVKSTHRSPIYPTGAPHKRERQNPGRAAAKNLARSPLAACPEAPSPAEIPTRIPNNPEAPTLLARPVREAWLSICTRSRPVQTGVMPPSTELRSGSFEIRQNVSDRVLRASQSPAYGRGVPLLFHR